MTPLFLDVETTGATNDTYGNPFTDSNKLCYVGLLNSNYKSWVIDFNNEPYGHKIIDISKILRGSSIFHCGFNIKFDLHWLRKYGCIDTYQIPVWDCQLAHFILSGQKAKYASLNDVLEYYGLSPKIDIVKTEYWDKGIDTDKIPTEIVEEYLQGDVEKTAQVFEKQKKELEDKPQLKKLIWHSCQDLLTTAEMEWNGLKYDMGQSKTIGSQVEERIWTIDKTLNGLFPGVPINWNSGDHLSCILFGGRIKVPFKETYNFTYRDGRTKEKSRNAIKEIEFPRLVDPPKGSELAKEGFFSTAEGILQKLKPQGKAKEIINGVLERSTLSTKLSRYYYGIPSLYEEMDWTNDLLHSSLNHSVAGTGRLSSNKPNIQNLEEEMRKCVISRFPQ